MSEASGVSRILTLVFADLADSTALKAQRGDQAVSELIARHRTHVRSLAIESSGRIIDWAGDGCFLTFETPSAAVLFGLRLQQAHHAEPDLPRVRIGMHLGEVSERAGPEDDAAHPRVEGLAVDLAARIAGLARPAQLLMSAAVANSARQRLDHRLFREPLRWQAYGGYSLKGFGEALQIHEVGLEGIARFVAPMASEKAAPLARPRGRAAVIAVGSLLLLGLVGFYVIRSHAPEEPVIPIAAAAKPAPVADTKVPSFGDRPAIAVLPFDNMSADPEQAFFADGLAEDLITRLSSWRAFPVIARNSSFQYRGGNLDLKHVGSELGARYLVEGSVRRAGTRIRVTAQLIDVPSGEHVWADTYDREVTDLFALQDEISGKIAASVASDTTRAEGKRAQQRGTSNLDAWSLYQLGQQHENWKSREANAQARRYYEQAIARDPGFASALARLAWINMFEVFFGWAESLEQQTTEAFENAQRANELDPREPVAYAALASVYALRGDVRNGLDAAKRAVDLNPSMPETWTVLSWLQVLAGEPEACIESSKMVRQLDPQGPFAWMADDNSAGALWELGRYPESLETAHRLIAARPSYYWGYVYVALNAVVLGDLATARAAIADARRAAPKLSIHFIQRTYGVARPDIDARRNAALREAGLE